jgi:fibronectin-binding autotransporter adhesin
MRTRNRNVLGAAARGVVVGTAFIGMINAARGQTTSTWVGAGTALGNPDSSWINAGNWNLLPPTAVDTALFDEAPMNGLTTISLGAVTQNIGNLTFDTANVPSYTIGADPADALGFLASGKIISTGLVTNSQTIAAGVSIASGATVTIANSATSTTLTMSGPITGLGSVTIPGAATVTSAGVFTVVLAGNNSYTGGTTLTSNSGVAIVLESNTAFGTGTVTMNNITGLNVQPAVTNLTIANPVTLTSGFTVSANATAPANLTFSGAVAFGATGRTMTINDYGKTVTFGQQGANASTITLPSGNAQAAVIIAGNNGGTAAAIVINDVIQDPTPAPGTLSTLSIGGGLANYEGTVLINSANTYGGKTTITPVSGSNGTSQVQPLVVGLGVSSVGSGSNITSGPFGTGALATGTGNANAPSIFEAVGADRTIGNNFTAGNGSGGGLFFNNPTTFGDNSFHNLILAGNFTNTSRTFTFNMDPSVAVYFGSGSALTSTFTGAGTYQAIVGHPANLVIGDQVTGATGSTIQNALICTLTNNTNNGSGKWTAQNGAVLKIGAPLALGSSPVTLGNASGQGSLVALANLPAPMNLPSLPTFAGQGGFIDLTNNGMVLNYTNDPVATVRTLLTTGFNAGAWNGTSTGGAINSSTAASDASMLHGLGYNDLPSGSTFDGVTLASNAVAVRYTYYGDTNLDGTVDTTDFGAFIDGVANGGNSWATGDFTYDGTADLGNDFNLFLASYLTLHPGGLGELAPIVEASSLSAGQKAQLLAAIPEPTSLGLLAAGAMGLMSRRRRRDA